MQTTAATWPEHELQKIAVTDNLHIAPYREDGATYRNADVDMVSRGGGRAKGRPFVRIAEPEVDPIPLISKGSRHRLKSKS